VFDYYGQDDTPSIIKFTIHENRSGIYVAALGRSMRMYLWQVPPVLTETTLKPHHISKEPKAASTNVVVDICFNNTYFVLLFTTQITIVTRSSLEPMEPACLYSVWMTVCRLN
jgi:hypothetical protein